MDLLFWIKLDMYAGCERVIDVPWYRLKALVIMYDMLRLLEDGGWQRARLRRPLRRLQL